MSRWYFTFGVGYDLADAYVVVEADTELDARVRFVEERSAVLAHPRRGWSSVYSEADFEASPQHWTREVPIATPAIGAD